MALAALMARCPLDQDLLRPCWFVLGEEAEIRAGGFATAAETVAL